MRNSNEDQHLLNSIDSTGDSNNALKYTSLGFAASIIMTFCLLISVIYRHPCPKIFLNIKKGMSRDKVKLEMTDSSEAGFIYGDSFKTKGADTWGFETHSGKWELTVFYDSSANAVDVIRVFRSHYSSYLDYDASKDL